jgi:DNA replication and repair protein RecF
VEIRRLEIRNLRCLQEIALEPAPGLNLLTGDNGAGKTSVLEALHLMAYGRSFRGRVRDGLIRSGTEAVEVFVAWQEDGGGSRRAGLRHGGQSWEGRLDGERLAHLGELCAAFMIVTFEPGSHALISGGGEPRRRFIDWGLFHVEPDFLDLWRRHSRALRQRNALLKAGNSGQQLDAWDHELAESGEAITLRRQQYLVRLQERVASAAAELAPELGAATLAFQPGWRREEMSLADALLLARDRDRSLGHTSVGPQRADWRLDFAALPNREPLSRGQGKLAALSCLLAQARDCAERRGDRPVIALDDLASELDQAHQQRLMTALLQTRAQLFVTGTDLPATIAGQAATMFHVEHGEIRARGD